MGLLGKTCQHQPLSSLDPGCEERQVKVGLENTVGLWGSEGSRFFLKAKAGRDCLSRVKCHDGCLMFLLEGPNAVLFWKDGGSGNDNGRNKAGRS